MEIDEEKIIEMVIDFRKDHGKLLRRLEDLERILGEISEEEPEVPLETAKDLREMAASFQEEFLGHCREEELVLYPLLRPYVDRGTCILDLVGQHTALREQVENFTKAVRLGKGQPRKILDQGFHLSKLAREHIRHEESVLFDLAERLLR